MRHHVDDDPERRPWAPLPAAPLGHGAAADEPDDEYAPRDHGRRAAERGNRTANPLDGTALDRPLVDDPLSDGPVRHDPVHYGSAGLRWPEGAPGSPEAIALGCRCPTLSNDPRAGLGLLIAPDCPVHR